MSKKTVKQGNVISFDPSSFTAGGLFDDEDAKVTEAQFEVWDYGGKADRETTALRLKLETNDGTEVEQYWSVGDPETYWPNENGNWIISTKSALNSSSNFAIFLSTLISASGFPLDKIEGNIGGLVGLDAHWMRVAPPKKRSVKKSTDDEGRERQDLVLVVSKINTLPGEGGKGKARAKTSPKKQEDAGGGDLETGSVDAVKMALQMEGDSIAKVQLAKKSLDFLPGEWTQKMKNDAVKDLIFNDKWLGDHPSEWTYAAGKVTAV